MRGCFRPFSGRKASQQGRSGGRGGCKEGLKPKPPLPARIATGDKGYESPGASLLRVPSLCSDGRRPNKIRTYTVGAPISAAVMCGVVGEAGF